MSERSRRIAGCLEQFREFYTVRPSAAGLFAGTHPREPVHSREFPRYSNESHNREGNSVPIEVRFFYAPVVELADDGDVARFCAILVVAHDCLRRPDIHEPLHILS